LTGPPASGEKPSKAFMLNKRFERYSLAEKKGMLPIKFFALLLYTFPSCLTHKILKRNFSKYIYSYCKGYGKKVLN